MSKIYILFTTGYSYKIFLSIQLNIKYNEKQKASMTKVWPVLINIVSAYYTVYGVTVAKHCKYAFVFLTEPTLVAEFGPAVTLRGWGGLTLPFSSC